MEDSLIYAKTCGPWCFVFHIEMCMVASPVSPNGLKALAHHFIQVEFIETKKSASRGEI